MPVGTDLGREMASTSCSELGQGNISPSVQTELSLVLAGAVSTRNRKWPAGA